MKRGNFRVSGELLTKILGLPDDFKMSGAEYNPCTNEVIIYGYSESFGDTLESCQSLAYPPEQFRRLEAEVDK